MKKTLKIFLAAAIFGIFGCSFISNNAFAADNAAASITEKWMFMGFYNCLSAHVRNPVYIDNYTYVGDAVFQENYSEYMFDSGISRYTLMPCASIYRGGLGYQGIMERAGYSGNTTWSDPAASEIMQKTGFKGSSCTSYSGAQGTQNQTCEDEGGQIIIAITTNKKIVQKTWSDYLSDHSKGDDYAIKTESTATEEGSIALNYFVEEGGTIYVQDATATGLGTLQVKVKDNTLQIYTGKRCKDSCVEIALGNSLDSIKGAINSANISSLSTTSTVSPTVAELVPGQSGTETTTTTTFSLSATSNSASSATSETYKTYDYQGRPDLGLYAMSGNKFSNNTQLLLDEDEEYSLYSYYIEQAFGSFDKLECTKGNSTSAVEVDLKYNGVWKKYYVEPSTAKKTTFIVQNRSTITSEEQGLQYIIDALNGMAQNPTDFETGECPNPDSDLNKDDIEEAISGTTTDGDPSDRCFEDAGTMGHILCPVLSASSQFMDAIYYYIENNFLMTNTTNGESGVQVQKAWGAVRDIANVGFVIVLLIVIFSQVTGFGIDNYGIKRILPRLIITAILVNISFFLCQIMIDISNIVGSSIKDLLTNTVKLDSAAETIGASGGAGGILATVAGGGILVGLVALNPGIILSLITGIIGALIGLLFLFVILIARQIGIVLMVILAPVAIICYMLPNTEKLFTSWRKIFVALLLAYPLCGLAVGGGTLVSNVLANAGSVEENAVLLIGAMVVNVLPYFFIPMLLKKSMAGLGNIGATISGLGQRLGRGATGAMRNSTGFRTLQTAGMERRNRIQAGLDKNGDLTRIGRLKAKVAGSRFGQSIGYDKLQKARVASAEEAITSKDLGVGQLVTNASTRRYQNRVDAIKAQTVQSNLVNSLGDVGGFNWEEATGASTYYNEDGSLKQTMAAQLYQYAMDGNQEGISAITEQLSEKGHHGQEAVRQVVSQLQKAGNNAAVQSISKAVMNNGKLASDYKSGARSSYDFFAKAAGAAGANEVAAMGNINDLRTNKIKADNYSEQSFANMDNEELERINQALQAGHISGTDATKIRRLAENALDNDLLVGGTKGKNATTMNTIAGRSIDAKGGSNGASGGGNVRNSSSAPIEVSDTLDTLSNAQEAAGANTAARNAASDRSARDAALDRTGEAYENIFNNQRNS